MTGTDVGSGGESTPETDVAGAGDTRPASAVTDAGSDTGDTGWLPTTGGPAFWLLLFGVVAVIGGAVALRLRRTRTAMI